MTAIDMKASQTEFLTGRLNESAANNSYESDFWLAVSNNPLLRSVPIIFILLLTPKYLPFPHPISNTTD